MQLKDYFENMTLQKLVDRYQEKQQLKILEYQI